MRGAGLGGGNAAHGWLPVEARLTGDSSRTKRVMGWYGRLTELRIHGAPCASLGESATAARMVRLADRVAGSSVRSASMGDPRDVTKLVVQLRGVTWEWKPDAPQEAREHQAGMGVIAQELEEVFPQLVITDDDGRKKVDYVGLVAPLIEAIKELDARLLAVEGELAQTERPPAAQDPN
jgi:hypothetical protein